MSDQRAVQRACRSALAARVASFARPRRAVKSPTPHSGAPKARGLTAMARTERSFTLPQKHVVIGHCPTDRVPNFTYYGVSVIALNSTSATILLPCSLRCRSLGAAL